MIGQTISHYKILEKLGEGEIPTPTWLAYDKAFYGDKIEMPKDAKLVHQERAYTSPVWYTP